MTLRSTKDIYYLPPSFVVRSTTGRAGWPAYAEYHFHKRIYWPLVALRGDWDRVQTDGTLDREEQMRDLFVRKIPYRETDMYRKLVKEFDENGCTRFPRLRSRPEIDAYFERLEGLYRSMKEEGCKSRAELGYSKINDIHIRITRDGRFVKSGEGTHRLALAKVLGLPAVPVVIDLVHTSLYRSWKKKSRGTGLSPIAFGIAQLTGNQQA